MTDMDVLLLLPSHERFTAGMVVEPERPSTLARALCLWIERAYAHDLSKYILDWEYYGFHNDGSDKDRRLLGSMTALDHSKLFSNKWYDIKGVMAHPGLSEAMGDKWPGAAELFAEADGCRDVVRVYAHAISRWLIDEEMPVVDVRGPKRIIDMLQEACDAVQRGPPGAWECEEWFDGRDTMSYVEYNPESAICYLFPDPDRPSPIQVDEFGRPLVVKLKQLASMLPLGKRPPGPPKGWETSGAAVYDGLVRFHEEVQLAFLMLESPSSEVVALACEVLCDLREV